MVAFGVLYYQDSGPLQRPVPQLSPLMQYSRLIVLQPSMPLPFVCAQTDSPRLYLLKTLLTH